MRRTFRSTGVGPLLVLASVACARAAHAQVVVETTPATAPVDVPATPVAVARPRVADALPYALRNALSVHVLTLLSAGITLQYERQLVRYLSVATSIGHRWSGGDSFSTNETSFGSELRFWMFGRMPFVHWRDRAMVGPYVGARLDGVLTRISEGERMVGSTMTFGESVSLGARFVFFHRVEVTPAAGMGLRHELDPRGRLARQTHIDWARFGLTAGVMF